MKRCLSIASVFVLGCSGADTNQKLLAVTTTSTTTTIAGPVISRIDSAAITVSGTANRNDYPVLDTLDDDDSSFMTTLPLSIGDTKWITYYLQDGEKKISRIDFVDNYTDQYNLGDLQIQVSNDSTNGVDGTWETVATVNAATTDFVLGDGSIDVDRDNVRWIKLSMTYSGSGAYGGSPSFYLSEIRFFEEL